MHLMHLTLNSYCLLNSLFLRKLIYIKVGIQSVSVEDIYIRLVVLLASLLDGEGRRFGDANREANRHLWGRRHRP